MWRFFPSGILGSWARPCKVCVYLCVSYAGAFINIGVRLKSWPAVVALSRGYGLGTKATL